MEKLQAFQTAARENGFVTVEESEEGTVLWLKKATLESEDRICLDSLTNSATVYWAGIENKLEDVSRCLRLASMDSVKGGHINLTIDFSVVLRPSGDKKECPTVAPLSAQCKPNKFRDQVSPARDLATWLFQTFPHSRQNR
jgi:hypothetical protein